MNYLIKQKEIEILKIELKIKKLELEILKDCDFEFFLRIEGYDNYFISNFGNIKNRKTNRIMKPANHPQGYKQIILYKNRKPKTFKIHRLVAIVFLENPDKKTKVDHIDENKANNNVKNLRWATASENLYNKGKTKKNTSGYKGVAFHKHKNKYQANIRINDKQNILDITKQQKKHQKHMKQKQKQFMANFIIKQITNN